MSDILWRGCCRRVNQARPPILLDFSICASLNLCVTTILIKPRGFCGCRIASLHPLSDVSTLWFYDFLLLFHCLASQFQPHHMMHFQSVYAFVHVYSPPPALALCEEKKHVWRFYRIVLTTSRLHAPARSWKNACKELWSCLGCVSRCTACWDSPWLHMLL